MHQIDPMNRERAMAVLMDYSSKLLREKFECLRGFLGSFRRDFRCEFVKITIMLRGGGL